MNEKKTKTPAQGTSESNSISIPKYNDDAQHLKELLEAAVNYVSRGHRVVPVGYGINDKGEENYKRPLIEWRKGGPLGTAEEVESAFRQLGNRIFGIALIIENYILVDFDAEGTDTLFNITPAPTISTGRGFHLWYAADHSIKINSAVDLSEFSKRDKKYYQLEIYTGNHLDIVPPSKHHTGVRYEWLIPPDDFIKLPELPSDIAKLCTRSKAKRGGRQAIDMPVKTGGRHHACLKAAMRYARQFSGAADKVTNATLEWNKKYCEEPLGEDEVMKIVTWAIEKREEDGETRQTKTKKVLDLILENDSIVLFHDQNKNGYARITSGERLLNVAIQSNEFAEYVRYTFYQETGGSISEQQLKEVLGICNVKAVYEQEQHTLQHRVAQVGDVFYYDLLNSAGEVVEIDQNGWRIVPGSKLPFLFKPGSCKEQVTPLPGGDLKDLLDIINIQDPDEQMLFLCTLPVRLIRSVDQAIAYIYGPAGSAKTTLLKMVKDLIDPSKGGISMPIRKIEDGVAMLSQSWLFANDNVSKIGNSLSDFLCVVATGAESSKRKLYTDTDMSVVSVKNPVFITGINIEAYRSDLLSRALLFKTEMVPQGKRRSAEEINTRFEELKPYLLGALFSTLSKAIRVKKEKQLKSEFRMADFGVWGAACAEVMGYGAEYFESALQISMKDRAYEAIYSSSVGRMVLELMNGRVEFIGTMTSLLRELKNLPGSSWGDEGSHDSQEVVAHNPASLGRKLRELENSLSEVGIIVDFGRRSSSERIITIRRVEKDSFHRAYDRMTAVTEDPTF